MSPPAPPPLSERPESEPGKALLWALLALFALTVVRTTWVSDDAFVTLRTIDNFLAGHGLRYNAAERVQAFTHPLWLALLTPVYALTRNAYATLLVTSWLCSILAVAWVGLRLGASPLAGALALACFLFSRAFVDYSTSGLETPLSHLLAVAFLAVYLRPGGSDGRTVLRLALLCSLAMCNRMDHALIFLPAVLATAWTTLRFGAWRPLLLGSLPFLAWELFSLVYYGFLVPNTAYAKLGAGVPRGALLLQGALYFVDSLHRDPLTLAVVLGGALFLVRLRDLRFRALASGILLYLLYVLCVGGDFMSGRFFTTVFVVAAGAIAAAGATRATLRVGLGTVGVIALLLPAQAHETGAAPSPAGIADERAHYAGWSALSALYRGSPILGSTGSVSLDPLKPGSVVKVQGSIGIEPFLGDPGVHVVDVLGLSEPLLARLPTRDPFGWRIGHLKRKVPAGYLQTLRSGENHIRDPNLASYYDRLRTIVRGELFSPGRLWTIVAMNLGAFDHLVDRERYATPHDREVQQSDFSTILPAGLPSDSPELIQLSRLDGLLVRLPEPSHCRRLTLGLGAGARYTLTYYREGEPVSELRPNGRDIVFRLPLDEGRGLRHRVVEVPARIARQSFDAVLIDAVNRHSQPLHSFGFLRLCDTPQ